LESDIKFYLFLFSQINIYLIKFGNQNLSLYKDIENETEHSYFKILKLFSTPNLRQRAKRRRYTRKFMKCNWICYYSMS